MQDASFEYELFDARSFGAVVLMGVLILESISWLSDTGCGLRVGCSLWLVFKALMLILLCSSLSMEAIVCESNFDGWTTEMSS